MTRLVLILTAAMPFTSAIAGEAEDKNLIESLGIDGRWAQHCSQPPSEQNIHVRYSTDASGPPLEAHSSEPGIEYTAPLFDVQWQKGEKVQWTLAEGEVMLTVVSELSGNRMRVWSSRATDGTVYADKGRATSGAATPWLTKCETN